MRGSSRFGLFSPTNGPNGRPSVDAAPFHELLALLDLFVEANHKRLLLNVDRIDSVRKTKIVTPYHRAKNRGNTSRFENYLENFIYAFEHDLERDPDFELGPELQATIVQYKNLLLTYENTKTVLHELNANARQQPSSSIESLVKKLSGYFDPKLELHKDDPELKFYEEWLNKFNALTKPEEAFESEETPLEETTVDAPALSKPQIALERLQTAFMHCINNHMTKDSLSWHPARHENYYLAKLKILWHNYEEQYGPVDQNILISTAAEAIIEEKRQGVIAKHVEAKNTLESQKPEHTQISLQRQHDKLQKRRDARLTAIETAQEELFTHANDIANSAADISSPEASAIFAAAMKEVERKEIAFSSSPALFNLCKSGKHQDEHAIAMLQKIDALREMLKFQELFRQQYATISAENHTVPAA